MVAAEIQIELAAQHRRADRDRLEFDHRMAVDRRDVERQIGAGERDEMLAARAIGRVSSFAPSGAGSEAAV